MLGRHRRERSSLGEAGLTFARALLSASTPGPSHEPPPHRSQPLAGHLPGPSGYIRQGPRRVNQPDSPPNSSSPSSRSSSDQDRRRSDSGGESSDQAPQPDVDQVHHLARLLEESLNLADDDLQGLAGLELNNELDQGQDQQQQPPAGGPEEVVVPQVAAPAVHAPNPPVVVVPAVLPAPPAPEPQVQANMAEQQQQGAFHARVDPVPEDGRPNLELVGHACFRQVIENAFQAKTLTDGLFARNAGDYLPAVNHRGYLNHLAVLCAGDLHNFPHISVADQLFAVDALIVANALAGFMQHLSAEEAQLRAKRALLLFLKHWIGPGKTTFIRLTDTEYGELKAPNGAWRNYAFLPEARADLRNLDVGGLVTSEVYDLAAYQCIMTHLLTLEAPRIVQTPPRVFATFFIGMAKRGTITVDKLNRITEELTDTLGIALDLDVASIRMTYKTVGGRVPDNKVRLLFEHLSSLVFEISLRMKITLDQAVGTGLTALSTIKRARKKFPHFPWARAARLLTNDFNNAATAARIVDTDAYYGFRKDLGSVRGTLYRSLAWLCKELLVRYGGPEHAPLARYQGWNNNPEHKATLVQMIDEFRPEAIAAEEADPTAATNLFTALEGATGIAA